MKNGKAIICAAFTLFGVTVFADVQVGTDPLDNMPLMVSDAQYAQMTNDAAQARVTVYRLELYRYGDTETPFIVGGDGVRRQVALVDPDEYAMLTGRVDQVWRSLNSTRDGRNKLHGAIVRTEVDAERHVRIETHKDGYRFEDVMPVKRMPTNAVPRKVSAGVRPARVKPRGMSERQWRARLEREDAARGKVREITVEHDALTGKDKVTK